LLYVCSCVTTSVSVRWVALFPLGSLVLLLLADVIAIVGHWTSRKALNFLAGILSVIAGRLCCMQYGISSILYRQILAKPPPKIVAGWGGALNDDDVRISVCSSVRPSTLPRAFDLLEIGAPQKLQICTRVTGTANLS